MIPARDPAQIDAAATINRYSGVAAFLREVVEKWGGKKPVIHVSGFSQGGAHAIDAAAWSGLPLPPDPNGATPFVTHYPTVGAYLSNRLGSNDSSNKRESN